VAAGAPRFGLADGLVCVGALICVFGVARLSLTAAILLVGVSLIGVGLLHAWRHG
jgi:hypothetical protein